MRTLLLTLACSLGLSAASFNITAVRIIKNNASTTSACDDAQVGALACNGSVAEFDTSNSVATGGTYAFNFSQASNNNSCPRTVNDTGAAYVQFVVTSSGYTNAGGATTYKRIVCGTHQLREPSPNPATNDETNNGTTTMTFRVALSDVIYAGDTVTVAVSHSFYTDGSANSLNTLAAGSAVTNNSTLPYSAGRAIANWSRPGWSRISGASFNVYAVCFSRHATKGLPCAAVVFSATDAHSHTVTVTVKAPTIDTSVADPIGPSGRLAVQEYSANISTSTLTQADLITVQFKAYPWIGDTTAVMDTSDGVNSQPTPLYAPTYYLLDKSNVYSAAAYVDGSANFAGTHTSGTFVAGEKVTQSTSGATAFLIDVTGANGTGPIHVGNVLSGTFSSTASLTWTGATSGAVFTASASPGPTYLGSDTNSCAVAESSWNPASPPSACRTINGAAVKMAAYNNASSTPTHNDACGTMYLNAGYYNQGGASGTVPSTTGNCWATVTPISGVTKAQVVMQGATGSLPFGSSSGPACTTGQTTSCGTPMHVQGLTINDASGPVSDFRYVTYLWLDNVALTTNATAPIYQSGLVAFTWGSSGSLGGNGLTAFGSDFTAFGLTRGVDITGVGTAFAYTFLGNINKTINALQILNSQTGSTASTAPIIAFNGLYRVTESSAPVVQVNNATSSIIGAAVVENILENNLNNATNPLIRITGDAADTSTPVNNTMLWHNVVVGGRVNRAYNETGTTIAQRLAWSEVGDIRDVEAIKADTFPTVNANRVGNWSSVYGTGRRSVVNVEINTGSTGFAATNTFQMEFGGLWSYNPAVTAGSTQPPVSGSSNGTAFVSYVSRQAYDGTNAGAGNGDYRVKSNSPAANMIPASQCVLPYDLNGQLRDCSGWGASGAFELPRTQVFGW